MQFDLSSRWTTADKGLYFVHNFTDVRAKVDFITGGDTIANETLTQKANSLWETGDNIVYNDTETREMHFVINGKNQTRKTLRVVGHRCIGACLPVIDASGIETAYRRWSNPASWPNNQIPLEGADVVIQPSWNMLYDIEESPIFNMIQINGRLTFEDGSKDLHLRSKYIFIRAGEMIIGNPEDPYKRNAKITLFGEKENAHIVYSNAIEAGNKILANTNKLRFYGLPRDGRSRLT